MLDFTWMAKTQRLDLTESKHKTKSYRKNIIEMNTDNSMLSSSMDVISEESSSNLMEEVQRLISTY